MSKKDKRGLKKEKHKNAIKEKSELHWPPQKEAREQEEVCSVGRDDGDVEDHEGMPRRVPGWF